MFISQETSSKRLVVELRLNSLLGAVLRRDTPLGDRNRPKQMTLGQAFVTGRQLPIVVRGERLQLRHVTLASRAKQQRRRCGPEGLRAAGTCTLSRTRRSTTRPISSS